MANVTPVFTRASNRIYSWPLALVECITRGILCFGKILAEKINGEECQLSGCRDIASIYSVIPNQVVVQQRRCQLYVYIFTIIVQIY